MKTIKVIETADELINCLMQTKKEGADDKTYLPPMELQIGCIYDAYVSIVNNEEYKLGPGITFKSLFYAMCIYMGLNIDEVKTNI